MVVEIRTSQDLLNLLDNNEEFRRAARRALLTDELLELPDLVREMQQTQRLMIQQIAQLAERMDKMEERQGRMEERQDRMEDLLARVVAQQELTNERLDRMDERMDRMDGRIGDMDGRLRGWELERESGAKLLPRLAREYGVVRIRAVSSDASRSAINVNHVWAVRFDEAIEEARRARRITMDDEDILGRTDIVAWGRRRSDEARQWFAVQASATIDNDDIERAAAGAVALRKVSGEDAAAAVYGRRIAAQQRVRADELGVAVMLDETGEQE